MTDLLISAALFAMVNLQTAPPAPVAASPLEARTIQQAAATAGVPAAARMVQTPSPSRDSLKNGAIIGAIAGGAAGAFLAAVGCALGGLYEGEDTSGCAGGTILLVGMGAGAGALIGVGIDALFEQAPAAGRPPRGRPIGMRVRLSF